MRFYRLHNVSEGAPASELLFLRREDAERYQEILRWPYAVTGLWPLAAGGEMPLDGVRFAAEAVEMDASVEEGLGLVALARNGALGGAPLLPGDCFDPGQWRECPPEERRHPVRGAAWDRAAAALKGGLGT